MYRLLYEEFYEHNQFNGEWVLRMKSSSDLFELCDLRRSFEFNEGVRNVVLCEDLSRDGNQFG